MIPYLQQYDQIHHHLDSELNLKNREHYTFYVYNK